MQRESWALVMEPRHFFRLGKRRLDGVPELLEHRAILVIGPPWSSLVLSHLGPRSGPSWSCLVLVGLAPRSLALAGPWFVFLGFPWSSVLLVLGPLGPRSLDLLGPSWILGLWSLVLVVGPWSSFLGPRSSVLGPCWSSWSSWSSVLVRPWSLVFPGPRSFSVFGPWSSVLVGRWNPPLLTRVARMRADALWEMKRRRDNLPEQPRLLHSELLAPDWLSGPHPPLHGRGVTGPPIGPTGPSVGAAPTPHSSHEWRG